MKEVLVGLAFLLLGLALLLGSTRSEAGAVIMIGPIPIAVGTSKKAVVIAVLAAALFLLLSIPLFSG